MRVEGKGEERSAERCSGVVRSKKILMDYCEKVKTIISLAPDLTINLSKSSEKISKARWAGV